MPARPWLVAICGLMGSGKTTLARGLARYFDWSYVPEYLPAIRYLDDLFSDTERWAFETQAAFLIYKALSLQEATQRGRDVILDRSTSEDINIFARYFYERGDLDSRSYETYRALAQNLSISLPLPDLLVFCDCPLDVIEKRISDRGRNFQKLYPPDHLERLESLYCEWKEDLEEIEVYSIDTHRFDTRDPRIADAIATEVASILNRRGDLTEQLSLFGGAPSPVPGEPELLKLIKGQGVVGRAERRLVRITASGLKTLEFPSAYIAAPFTAQAAPPEFMPGLLFDIAPAHGIIKQSRFRRMLTAVDKELRKIGISGLLPHRDINKWGRRRLTPEQVANLCTDYVRAADVFLGIPSLSHGSHYELGLALGLGKPSVVIHCDEIPSSFISSGLTSRPDRLLIMRCKRVNQVPALIKSGEVKNFYGRHIPLLGG